MTSRNTPAMQLSAALAILVLFVAPAFAQDDSGPQVRRGAELVEVVTPTLFSGDIRNLPTVQPWRPGDAIKEIPRRHYPRPGGSSGPPVNTVASSRDPLLDAQSRAVPSPSSVFDSPDVNIAGQGFSGVNPPDTVGEVGQNFYIQMINDAAGSTLAVYDKTDGSVAAGPITLDSLAGGGFCGNGLGDPVVLYDHLASRWLLSEFSSSGNRLCVYISQTSDPITGGWFTYDFSATNFPDYPKYAVWPDAYYIGTNENSTAAYALERAQMLTGAAASVQRFTAPDLGGFGFQALTPSDLDGSAPPAGAPAYFLRHNDDESHNPGSNNPASDSLEIFEFAVDFASPANSTFTGPIQIPIAEFDSDLCGLVSFNCIQQPGTDTELDPLREVVMWRSQYRNFGSHQVLVGNLATDVDGTDHAGVRWYELRNTGGGWTLFQEGTYAIDGDSRWMGSAAMDSTGNIAVGYNISSASTFPGLRYAGRLAADPAGTLPQGENVLVDGTAANGSNRYGDYASLNVDPADGCTFWFTGEYNTTSQWSTRIGSFAFANCGGTCGNNVIESGELCDGTDLGGESCGSQGCSGGGTLACNASCNGFDSSGCSLCPICDNDDVCEAGEDCFNCGNDCISGTTSGAACGNGLCEAGNGEDCLSCPADCNGKQNGKPSNRFCCGDGAGENPILCSDGDGSVCNSSGFSCTDMPQTAVNYCCGDASCEGAETIGNCAIDCDSCGDLFCDPATENMCSCALDCGTPPGSEAGLCTNGIDDDCDGVFDCADGDCFSDPACACLPGGSSCSANGDCCSNKCKNGTCRGN